MNKSRVKYSLFLFLGAISFISYAQSSKDSISINLVQEKTSDIYPRENQIEPNPLIDSLKNVLKTAPEDTNKIRLFLKISYQFEIRGGLDTAVSYAEKGGVLAEKIGFKKGIVYALETIGGNLFYKGNYGKALDYEMKSLAISTQIRYKEGMATSMRGIGDIYFTQSNYSGALEYFTKSLSLAQKVEDTANIYSDYGGIGSVYSSLGNYSKALEYQFKALAIEEKKGNTYYIASTFGDIATVYDAQGNYSKALEYNFKGLSIIQKGGDTYALAYYYLNIGNIYNEQKNYTQALEYEFKALTLENGDAIVISRSLNVIGLVYCGQGNYADALTYYSRALSTAREFKDKDMIGTIYSNLGGVYTKLKKYKEAKALLDSALIISKIVGDKKNIEGTYSNLSVLDSAMGNSKNSYEDYKQYIIYRDSINSQESIKKIAQMEISREFERREDSAKVEQEKASIIKTAETNRKRIATNSVIVILLLLVLLAVLLINRQQIKRKKDKLVYENETNLLLLKKQQMEVELAKAQTMLDKYIKSMVEKNNRLEQITTDLEELKNLKTKEIDENRIEQIEHLNKKTILTEEDWDKFKELFEQVHKGFLIRLKEKLPDLTPAEVRLLCLTKLQLDTKQMAGILGVSLDTVKKTRQRLRKKLSLTEEDSINDILKGL